MMDEQMMCNVDRLYNALWSKNTAPQIVPGYVPDVLYTYNKEEDKIEERKVVYKNAECVWLLEEAALSCKDINYEEAALSCKDIGLVMFDPGQFRDKYTYYFYGCMNHLMFVSRELAQEYVDDVKKYGKLWTLEDDIDRLKTKINEAEKKMKMDKQLLASMSDRLDEMRRKLVE